VHELQKTFSAFFSLTQMSRTHTHTGYHFFYNNVECIIICESCTRAKSTYESIKNQTIFSVSERNAWSTERKIFMRLLTHEPVEQLRIIFDEYRRMSGQSMQESIQTEFSGDLRNAMLTIGEYMYTHYICIQRISINSYLKIIIIYNYTKNSHTSFILFVSSVMYTQQKYEIFSTPPFHNSISVLARTLTRITYHFCYRFFHHFIYLYMYFPCFPYYDIREHTSAFFLYFLH